MTISLIIRLFWDLLLVRRAAHPGFDIGAQKYFLVFRYGMTAVVRSREKSAALHAQCIAAIGREARQHETGAEVGRCALQRHHVQGRRFAAGGHVAFDRLAEVVDACADALLPAESCARPPVLAFEYFSSKKALEILAAIPISDRSV
jgi:hypothetical protein